MKKLTDLSRKVLGLLLLAMVALNVANAGGRYILQKSIPGSDELLVFAMVWLVFLGACIVSLDRSHLSFGLLAGRIAPDWRRRLDRLKSCLIALLCGYLSFYSWQVLQTLGRVGQKSMASELPMVIPHAAVPLSLAVICVISFYQAVWPRKEGAS